MVTKFGGQILVTKFGFVPDWLLYHPGFEIKGAEGQNAPNLIPNAPRLLNLGAKFCYPIQPDICFEA